MKSAVLLAFALLFCAGVSSALTIYKEVVQGCVVETSQGILDLREAASVDGKTAKFSASMGKNGTIMWNPCWDTKIPDQKCDAPASVFLTNSLGCESVAKSRDTSFDVGKNGHLELHYMSYETNVNTHITLVCTRQYLKEPFTVNPDCWDPKGRCFYFAHPDVCFHQLQSTTWHDEIIVSAGNTSICNLFLLLAVLAFRQLW